MLFQLAPRKMFSILQILVGLFAPMAYATTLTNYFPVEADIYQTLYWLGIPTVCFLTLAWASLSLRGGRFRISNHGIWGAAIAGYLCFIFPAMLSWLVASYSGGTNLGVGLLIVAMPAYLPVAMVTGFIVGEYLLRRS